MRRFFVVTCMTGILLAGTPTLAATSTTQDLTNRLKASLAVPTHRGEPALGSVEQDTSIPVPIQAPDSEPEALDRDLTGGIMAAGAALLSAVVILLLVAIVANSKHQEK